MKVSNYRLGIALPLVDDRVPTQFLDSWTLMEKPEYTYIRPDFPGYIAAVRNNLVEYAIQAGCSHLLMMDTDQIYPSDTIMKLIEHDLPIVGAKVHRRYPPFDPIMYKWDREIGRYFMLPEEIWKNESLPEVDVVGTGCILVDIKVFMDLEYPWFKHESVSLKSGQKAVGEDVYFCRKAKEAGYQIFADTTIKIDHLGLLSINEETYEVYKMLTLIGGKKDGGN